jgi:hypothetical protein
MIVFIDAGPATAFARRADRAHRSFEESDDHDEACASVAPGARVAAVLRGATASSPAAIHTAVTADTTGATA